MESFNKKFNYLIESFEEDTLPSSIKMSKRIYYPKKLRGELSSEFINCFKAERKRLIEKGYKPSQVTQGIAKALLFFHSRY